MKLARSLLLLSAVVFAVTAIGYLVVPGVMLSVVGVASNGTADFLIRTEGVALLAGTMCAQVLTRTTIADPIITGCFLVFLAGFPPSDPSGEAGVRVARDARLWGRRRSLDAAAGRRWPAGWRRP